MKTTDSHLSFVFKSLYQNPAGHKELHVFHLHEETNAIHYVTLFI